MRAEACVLTMSGVQGKRDRQVEDAMAGSQLRREKLDLRLTPTAKQTLQRAGAADPPELQHPARPAPGPADE